MLVYKALHNLLPAYLAEDCQLVSVTGHRRLRSSDTDTCLVQRTNTRFGDRSFAAAGPQVGLWNSLPIQRCESQTLYFDNFDEHSKRIYSVSRKKRYRNGFFCNVFHETRVILMKFGTLFLE